MAVDMAWQKGLDVVDQVYGSRARTMMDGLDGSLYLRDGEPSVRL